MPSGAAQEARYPAGRLGDIQAVTDTGVTLPDGTELFISSITFAADGPAFTLPPEDGDPPEFAALADEYAEVLWPSSRPPARSRTGVRTPYRHGFALHAAFAPDEAMVAG